jgi:Protein of unknown function (DUF2723)
MAADLQQTGTPQPGRKRADLWWALVTGLVALAVYVRTLAPGLVDDVDGSMFQFIGRALGVAHNPGYPLFVLLTWPFSFLPIGTLAYRINLFSALLGATTASLAFLVCRRLGCRPLISLAAALALAFGRVFWSQAIVAEVYTLHAATVMGMVLALLVWREERRSRWFFVAVALLAAGLGNHTTIVGFVPGALAFVLLTDRAFVLRPRTLALSIAILAAGLLQYALVLVRSRQPGAYVESRATDVWQLVDVMLGRQFRDRLFAFDVNEVLARVATVARDVARPELTLAGLALCVVGGVWLARRRPRQAILLSGGAVATAAFAVNYAVVDTPVFLIPALVVLWLMAAVGLERLATAAGRVRGAAATIVAASLLLPAVQLARNARVNDRSRDTGAARFFEALFDVLPSRAALVREDFIVDRMVMFKLLGDRAAKGRSIELAPRDPGVLSRRLRDGVAVLGFGESAWQLRYEALNFSFGPMALAREPLEEFLARLDAGAIVAVAVPGSLARRFTASGGALLGAIGGPAMLAGVTASNIAIVGAKGATGAALVRVSPFDIDMRVDPSAAIGPAHAPAGSAIEVRAQGDGAAIHHGSREIVETSRGVAIAVWSADGRLAYTSVLQERDGFRVPVQNALAVHPLRGVLPSQQVRTAWTDVRQVLSSGSAIVRAPAGEAVVLYVRDETPLAPRAIDRSSDQVRVAIEAVVGEARLAVAEHVVAAAPADAASAAEGSVYRVEVRAPDGYSGSAFLAFGGVPTHAVGRVAASNECEDAVVVGVDTEGLLRAPDEVSEVLFMTRDDQAQLAGDGWSAVDADGVGAWRWMTAPEARLLLPIAQAAMARIRVQALLAEGDGPEAIRLRLNGSALPWQRLRRGWHVYEWQAPPDALHPGTNEAAIVVDRLPPVASGGSPRAIAVAKIHVVHERP